MERGHMLRLGAVHKTVTKANIVCSMLSEEVPALVLASGGDLTRVGTRVTNMPGAVARTSTFALNNATLPFILSIAELGTKEALRKDPHLMSGLNVCDGKLTYQAVAHAQGRDYTKPSEVLNLRG